MSAIEQIMHHRLINFRGIGVGLPAVSAADPGDNPDASTFSVGVGVWWALSGVAAGQQPRQHVRQAVPSVWPGSGAKGRSVPGHPGGARPDRSVNGSTTPS
jgi:hypothetical protein